MPRCSCSCTMQDLYKATPSRVAVNNNNECYARNHRRVRPVLTVLPTYVKEFVYYYLCRDEYQATQERHIHTLTVNSQIPPCVPRMQLIH